MDWLLIGNVTTNRIGANTVGDTSPFMEGREWLRDSTLQAETAVISERDFHDLMSYCSELDPSQIGGLSRIHGRGCESGLADGHLSRWPVLATVGGMEPSFEWSFAPRYGVGLGVPGDSGAWIFTETGALLGQILGHNQFTQMTYYTPIWALFDHIKGVTGANEVRLPPKTLTSASDSGYESSCTPPDSTAPEKSGV
ncbi:MAG: hypothetical protein M1830_000256 [Pleopsidium flavum]|nr:MAG: hypothetical protein M1830_000256 [Pleopsidium flavum]